MAVYSDGKVEHDIYIPPEEFARLPEQFGSEHGALIDRIEAQQAEPTWTPPPNSQ